MESSFKQSAVGLSPAVGVCLAIRISDNKGAFRHANEILHTIAVVQKWGSYLYHS
jgi:hypothetical protein